MTHSLLLDTICQRPLADAKNEDVNRLHGMRAYSKSKHTEETFKAPLSTAQLNQMPEHA